MQRPQASVTVQTLAFSEEMSYEQLAVWLTNHKKFVKADYQQDIKILKGAKLMTMESSVLSVLIDVHLTLLDNRIDGYALLSLDESTLREFGVSYGFKLTLINIIEDLVCDI